VSDPPRPELVFMCPVDDGPRCQRSHDLASYIEHLEAENTVLHNDRAAGLAQVMLAKDRIAELEVVNWERMDRIAESAPLRPEWRPYMPVLDPAGCPYNWPCWRVAGQWHDYAERLEAEDRARGEWRDAASNIEHLEAELSELRELHDGTLHEWADEREHLEARIAELEEPPQ